MLAVFVDVLQSRLRSAYRTIIILSLPPPPSLFTFIAQTRAGDVRIITSDFSDDDWVVHAAIGLELRVDG
jgi:hypothetical protein